MAIRNFGVDQGLSIFTADIDDRVDIIKGTGVPGGDSGGTGIQDDAPVGSLFLRDNGELYKKVSSTNAPVDWKRISSDEALDVFLGAAYDNTTNGSPADGDSIELALGYLDANQLDLVTLSGVAKGDVDLGTFTGSTIQDNRTVKQALQDLETGIENISGGGKAQALGVTSATTVGAILVDDSFHAEFEVIVEDAASPENRRSLKVNCLHDGTASADATTIDFTRFARNRVGTFFNATITPVLSGTGATQEFGVEVASTEPSGVNVYVRRTQIL